MKEYKADSIRNIAILGHMGCGKTSLCESMLYVSKAIEKKGEVERKNTVGDFLPEEQNRQTTLSSSLIPVEWKNTKINFLDTPGSEEFVGELNNVLSVVDGAIILIDSSRGVEIGTERVWDELAKRNIPVIVVNNKLEKENIKYNEVLDSIADKLDKKATQFFIPLGVSENFNGYVDVVSKKAFSYAGGKVAEVSIPSDLTSQVEEINGSVIEFAAETCEELLEKYFGGEELTFEEIAKGLKNSLKSRDIFPVITTSGLKNIGIEGLLDAIVSYMPAASELEKEGINPKDKSTVIRKTTDASLSGLAFKTTIDSFVGTITMFRVYSGSLKTAQEVYLPESDTTVKMPQLFTLMGKTQIPLETIYAGDIAAVANLPEITTNVSFCDKKYPVIFEKIAYPTPTIYIAIAPKNKQDEDKISSSLQKIQLEDASFEIKRNEETAQMLLGGQGMTHLGYIVEKMRNMFKVELETSDPKIVYRETIKAKGEAQGRHKKQSGGAGQFGDVWIRFEPTSEEFEFAEEIFGGAVPKNYFPAVEKGLREAMKRGPLAGFPVIGVKATLYDGSYHPVDSNELSFVLAAQLSFKEACKSIKPAILEPIMKINVIVKDEYLGAIMGDVTKRRGRVLGTEPLDNGWQEVVAEVPESEIIKYTTDLKALTQGSGRFSRSFLRYEEVRDDSLVSKIINEYKKQ